MCTCIEEYNEMLESQGLKLDLVFFWSGGRKPVIRIPLIVTDESARKGKPKATLFGSFCPFCGEEIPDSAPAPDPYPTASVTPQSAPEPSDGHKLDNIGGVEIVSADEYRRFMEWAEDHKEELL